MPQIQVRFGAIAQHVNFAVLEGAHRAGIDVEIGIKLLNSHLESANFEQRSESSGSEAFAQRRNDPARHENIFHCKGLKVRPEP